MGRLSCCPCSHRMGPKRKDKTPSKSAEKERISIEGFSPVQLPESPSPSKQGNLTGSARKLKDGAADLHSLLQKWQSLNAQGANIISNISNMKLEAILSQSEDRETQVDLLPDTLLPLCDQLDSLLKKMEKISSRLTALAEMVDGISKLEKHGTDEDCAIVLFQTWDVTHFATVFTEIAEMYRAEFQLKTCIYQNVCHASDRNTLMFYSAAWIHEPHIDHRTKLHLESVLLETGHKT